MEVFRLFRKQEKPSFMLFLGKNEDIAINIKYLRIIVFNEKNLEITVKLDSHYNTTTYENKEGFNNARNRILKTIGNYNAPTNS